MGRLIEEVVEDIKNGTWGSDIEYRSECEKLHELCDEILEIEKAKTEKIVAGLESLANYNGNAYLDSADAIEIVRKGGVE